MACVRARSSERELSGLRNLFPVQRPLLDPIAISAFRRSQYHQGSLGRYIAHLIRPQSHRRRGRVDFRDQLLPVKCVISTVGIVFPHHAFWQRWATVAQYCHHPPIGIERYTPHRLVTAVRGRQGLAVAIHSLTPHQSPGSHDRGSHLFLSRSKRSLRIIALKAIKPAFSFSTLTRREAALESAVRRRPIESVREANCRC